MWEDWPAGGRPDGVGVRREVRALQHDGADGRIRIHELLCPVDHYGLEPVPVFRQQVASLLFPQDAPKVRVFDSSGQHRIFFRRPPRAQVVLLAQQFVVYGQDADPPVPVQHSRHDGHPHKRRREDRNVDGRSHGRLVYRHEAAAAADALHSGPLEVPGGLHPGFRRAECDARVGEVHPGGVVYLPVKDGERERLGVPHVAHRPPYRAPLHHDPDVEPVVGQVQLINR